MGAPGFWDDQAEAARISQEHARVTRKLATCERLRVSTTTRRSCSSSSRASRRTSPGARHRSRASSIGSRRRRSSAATTTRATPSSPSPPGSGGTDAQDWAEMLLRMYLRWAADRGFETELVEASPGEEAGLKSATLDGQGRERLRPVQGRAGCAPARAALTVRLCAPAPHGVRAGRGGAAAAPTRRKSRSTRPTCASTRTGRAAPAGST